jgi:hypothetical protein
MFSDPRLFATAVAIRKAFDSALEGIGGVGREGEEGLLKIGRLKVKEIACVEVAHGLFKAERSDGQENWTDRNGGRREEGRTEIRKDCWPTALKEMSDVGRTSRCEKVQAKPCSKCA